MWHLWARSQQCSRSDSIEFLAVPIAVIRRYGLTSNEAINTDKTRQRETDWGLYKSIREWLCTARTILVTFWLFWTWMPLMWSFASDGHYRGLFAWFLEKKSSKIFIHEIMAYHCNWNLFYTFFLFQQFLPVQFYTNLHKDLFCWENAVIQHFCRVPLICRRHIHSTAFLGAWIPNIFGRKTSLTANLYCCFWKILI